MSKLDPLQLREAFGKFMTGVTVVTVVDKNGTPLGFTANSFSSVSLEPPLLLVCPAKSMSSFDVFAECDYFHVSVLAYTQQSISNTFASSSDDRFQDLALTPDQNGVPPINCDNASFACKRDRSIDAGDHIILLGEVTHFESNDERGLGYGEGGYFSLELERKASEVENTIHASDKHVLAGALLEWQDQLLLLNRTNGEFEFPTIELIDGHASFELLEEYLHDLLDIPLSVGSVFSIYEHQGSDKTSIYYRVSLEGQSPRQQKQLEFYKLDTIDVNNFASNAAMAIFERYMAERKSGNHSIAIQTPKAS